MSSSANPSEASEVAIVDLPSTEIAEPPVPRTKRRSKKSMKTDTSYKTRMGLNVPSVPTIEKYDISRADLLDCLKNVDRTKFGKNRQTRLRALERYLGVENLTTLVVEVNCSILCDACRQRVLDKNAGSEVFISKRMKKDHGLDTCPPTSNKIN